MPTAILQNRQLTRPSHEEYWDISRTHPAFVLRYSLLDCDILGMLHRDSIATTAYSSSLSLRWTV